MGYASLILTNGAMTMIKNRVLNTALDATPEAIEPALSMTYHVTIANVDVLIIFVLLALIAGATTANKKMENAASNPAPIEDSHLTSLLNSAEKLSSGQSIKSIRNRAGKLMDVYGASDQIKLNAIKPMATTCMSCVLTTNDITNLYLLYGVSLYSNENPKQLPER